MKYQKPPLSINNQIVRLKSKGLTIHELAKAKSTLRTVNYYRLSSYFIPFYKIRTSKFRKNTTFQQISELYDFDNQLRWILFGAIQKIEIGIRAQLINEYSNSYGSHWFSQVNLFKDFNDFSSFQSKAYKIIADNRNKEKFISHYMAKYNDPPIPANWMIVELLTFGQMSRLYKSLRDDRTKKDIATKFGVTEKVLESWLHNLNYIRNITAHHIRLWNRDLRITPMNPRRIRYQFLNSRGASSHQKLYFTLSVIIYLLKRFDPNCNIARQILDLFGNTTSTITNQMGFPQNYKIEPLWN